MLQLLNRQPDALEVRADMKSALRATVEFKTGPRLYSKNYNRRVSCPEVALASTETSRRELVVNNERVKINISGKMYETLYSTLARFPETLLGSPSKRMKYFDQGRQEYFFNRNRNAFDAILFYYQSNGLLTRPENIRLQEFCEELKFFEIGEETLKEFKRDEGALDDDDEEEVTLPSNFILAKIWLWFEYPALSKVSRLVATISVFLITLSIVVLCAESVIQNETTNLTKSENNNERGNYAEVPGIYELLERVYIAWFTLEFVLRIISCPNKTKFLRDILNLIDLASLIPFYYQLFSNKDSGPGNKIEVTGLLRVSRLFKLFRHLDELKVLVKTVRATWRELIMIMFFILITTAIFSGWTFYVEHESQKEKFSSIPASAWFVIISLTNVGYGDMVPITILGKLLGAICTLAGVLVIALPSPVIVTKFRFFYENKKRKKLSSYRF